MRAPVVLGTFVVCSAAYAQSLPTSPSGANAPVVVSPDKSEVRQNVSAEVRVNGNNGKGLGRKVAEIGKALRRRVASGERPPTPPAPLPKPEPIKRLVPARDLREELAEQRANLRMERTRLLIKDHVAAVKEQIAEKRKL